MFLKRFEAKGFKSFADHTVMNFNENMTGIVGPNGSGKSNIVDGLKWVLGERSLKQLRGKHSTDFIFSGSDARDAANFAEVSLTFDNSSGKLRTDLQTITVTRRLERGMGKNEYFINGEPTTQYDLKDIFLDTGLAKGSLGIISQGAVASFIDAKTIDRRKVFEDASGIGKYTLTKKETISELTKAEYLFRDAETKLNEAEKVINRLTKAAEKAQVYLQKKEQLEKVELTIITKDILEYKNTLANIQKKLEVEKEQHANDFNEIQVLENKIDNIKNKLKEINLTASSELNELDELNAQLNELRTKKILLENKLNSQLNSENIAEQIAALKAMINSLQASEQELLAQKNELSNELNTYNEIKNDFDKKYTNLSQQISVLQQKSYSKQNELNQIQNTLANKYRYEYGLKAIIENKKHLSGIYDVLENLIKIDPQHETAIVSALGKSLKNIVVRNDQDVQSAVNFLKKNKAGKATFMPIESLKNKPFSQDHYDILNQLNGFVGMANELVKIDLKFKVAIDVLLSRIIVADSLENAFILSNYTNKLYRVITLNGDNIFTSGIVSGGYERKSVSQNSLNLEEKKVLLENEIKEINTTLLDLKKEVDNLVSSSRENVEKINSTSTQIQITNSKINDIVNKIKTYQADLSHHDAELNHDEVDEKSEIEKVSLAILELEMQTQKLKSVVDTNNVLVSSLNSELQTYDNELRILNKKNNDLNQAIHELKNDQTRFQTLYDWLVSRLSENYKMTVEYAIENFDGELNMPVDDARELVRTLRDEIEKLGTVNLEAAEELKNLSSDYEYKKSMHDELLQSCETLRNAILELDKKAKEAFNDVVTKVNESLPEIFKYLFGGGTCIVVYEDPENILETGLEIQVHLPGKTITSLSLFSGGEKTLIALSVLFAILKVSALPLVILDEAEAALDQKNVERFAKIIKHYSENTQFLVITHRPGTMATCDSLYGITMMIRGITNVLKVELDTAQKYTNEAKGK